MHLQVRSDNMMNFNDYLKRCEDNRKVIENQYPFLKNIQYFNTKEEKEWEEQEHTLVIYHMYYRLNHRQ